MFDMFEAQKQNVQIFPLKLKMSTKLFIITLTTSQPSTPPAPATVDYPKLSHIILPKQEFNQEIIKEWMKLFNGFLADQERLGRLRFGIGDRLIICLYLR